MSDLSPLAEKHLKQIASFYDTAKAPSWAGRHYRQMLAHYYNGLIPASANVLEVGCADGYLLELLHGGSKTGIDVSTRQVEWAKERVPDAQFHAQAGEMIALDTAFGCIVLSDTINTAADVQRLFANLHQVAHPKTQLMINFHNTLWRPLFTLACLLGLKRKEPESSWLAGSDVRNLLELADWEIIKNSSHILCPVKVPLLARLLNHWLAPFLPSFCLTQFYIARPRQRRQLKQLSTSVIVPARNEAGNIEEILKRMPSLGTETELIFVEGGSTDNTWEEIQRVKDEYPMVNMRILQQTGTGKGDAVRMGFSAATGDILMILDADMTMPPEELSKFYEVIAGGHAEFANGVRLVYPLENQSMRFMNMCANKAFSLLFTWLLGQSVKDTLCGTKAMLREDYEKLAVNRDCFGDFDPFGDFDLLFGASRLNLKISDIPIRYAARTYGKTNIARWKNGVLLLRMVWFAAGKLRFKYYGR